MTATEQYNGYANKQTWLVMLWIDNDQGEQDFWHEETRTTVHCNTYGDRHTDDILAASKSLLADHLKDLFEDKMPELTGFWADLMGHALAHVEWFDIAANLLQAIDAEEYIAQIKAEEA